MAIGRGTSFSVDKAIVIGAGIVGASIAYNLSKRGCEVLVVFGEVRAVRWVVRGEVQGVGCESRLAVDGCNVPEVGGESAGDDGGD